MEQSEHRRYVPDHAVPVPLSTVVNSKTDRIAFGKVELVRVQVMGALESIEFNENDMDMVLLDHDNEHRIMVQKIFTSSFPRELAQQLQVGQLIEVFGKIRVMDEGDPFLNALAIHIVTEPQFEAFQTMCRISKMFYEMHTPTLPPGTSCTVPQKMGLSKKLGSLDRFPVSFLEQSTSIENNMGEWPIEIEQLAAGLPLSSRSNKRKRVDTDDEESGKEENGGVHEKNGGANEKESTKSKMKKGVPDFTNDNVIDDEDSFDAGPVNVDVDKNNHTGNDLADDYDKKVTPDSFEADVPKATEQARKNELTQDSKTTVEIDSFETEVKAQLVENVHQNEDVPDSFDEVMKVPDTLEQNGVKTAYESNIDLDDSFETGVAKMEMAAPIEQVPDHVMEVASAIVDSFEAGPLKTNANEDQVQAKMTQETNSDVEYDSFENL